MPTTDPTPTATTRLLVEVTWHGNYYLPGERAEMVRDWIAGALDDRDDSPGVEIREAPADAAIPGWVHEQTVTFDGDTHWLTCDFCEAPVHPIDAGDSLETIVTKARDHRRTCTSANGDDRG